ncbi:MAG: aminodeoxychorismate/anthranilate synthase component II [Candidatus Marinimicrobia bacterium]|nr:aminodeoxychorismate/anthranilate synthase component II [Candidatus Neomarinimicrobiota bacterium]MCF7850606.1 aminodeoxychorismate/anthranilate synthase component II [Candidatus Neomarinimicrobiota bacterium]MCF7903660.1 aminodeoxychorismate/anthranilate synthase component II [Candidatus Neomarinimicrobiota bacterium]
MILLIDNYDSFTYNLYQQISNCGAEVRVVKNDELSVDQILELKPEQIVLSPGPKTPAASGVSIPLIQALQGSIPLLGICLGHQCIAKAYGQTIRPAQKLLFGKTAAVTRSASRLLVDLPQEFQVARYHSLVIDDIPDGFYGTSTDAWGDIMSMEHESDAIFGVQFHPESFLMLEQGNMIIKRFLEFV